MKISVFGSSETDIYRDLISGSILIFPNNFFIAMFPNNIRASNPQLTKDLGGHLTECCAYIWLDINGYKGPNKYGRDVFHFALGSDGNLYPGGGADAALFAVQTPLEANTRYWRNSQQCDTDVLNGFCCAARIIENGWKMDY